MDPIKVVGVIGMGYVGIPSAVAFAQVYDKVWGFQRLSESSGHKIAQLNKGIYQLKGEEPELPDLLKEVVTSGKFVCTSDMSKLSECDAITITVQTPVGNTSALMEACMSIVKYGKVGTLVVIESTVPPGTTKAMKSLLKDFMVAHAPERVTPGRLLRNLTEHDRVIGGVDEWDTQRAIELYTPVVGKIIPMSSTAAEVTKTAENAFRDLQIAAVNQLAMYCEDLGVSVWDVKAGIDSLKGEGITRALLQPGAGVGGHCLPKDTYYLVNNVRTDVPSIFVLARKINDFMPAHMFELLNSALEPCNIDHPKIAILGWAFSPNTGDCRNTPAGLFRELCLKSGMDVSCHDPYVWDVELGSVVTSADAIVVFTAHNCYGELNPEWLAGLMNTLIVIDGRNVINPEEFISAGFIYRGVGRGDLNG